MQLRSLQILRAVAAASVVYYHIGRLPQFGSFGVDLFFVLSGFVIAMIARTDASPLVFASNRITRVVPLYWILTTFTLMVAFAAPSLMRDTTANLPDYLRSILFIPYFRRGGALQPMLGVGWTLNYEMFFYTLATIALVTARRDVFAYVTGGLVVIASVIGLFLPDGSAYGEFLRFDLLSEFIMGIIAWNVKDAAIWGRIPKWVVLAVLVALYVLMAYLETVDAPFRILSYGIPAFLIVLGAYQSEGLVGHLHARLVALLVQLGDASYATYLSHLYCVDFAKRILARYTGEAAVYSPAGVTGILIASLACGSAVYYAVDRPSVRIARRMAKSLLRR
jgi:peptidoglycan/LPS O-acetylase OafA/YrhL